MSVRFAVLFCVLLLGFYGVGALAADADPADADPGELLAEQSDESTKSTSCPRALMATGLDWIGTRNSPLVAIHPAYSPTAEAIYFHYASSGLTIHLEQGPRERTHTLGNKIKRFYFE